MFMLVRHKTGTCIDCLHNLNPIYLSAIAYKGTIYK